MVLAEHPRDPDAHFNVGLASLYSGNHLAAAEAFRAVTELLPDEPAGYEKLAVALARLDRRAEALEQAAKAARLDPESASIRKLVQALGGQT
jgi:Flp pilus assembly protein TadD